MIKPFESIVFQLFLDLLRASGMALNAQQIEQLRSASQNFSHSFKAEAQLACLSFLKEFQDNVKETIDELEKRVKTLEGPDCTIAPKNLRLDKSQNNPDN